MDSKESKKKKAVRWCKRFLKWTMVLVLTYIGVLLVGLIPVSNGFRESKNGIKIFLVSNAVHADVIVPKCTESVDWGDEFADANFSADVFGRTHVAFAWGDKGFFLETETWGDFKFSAAVNALLLPSDSCVHVSFTQPNYYANAVSVVISAEQYRLLVDFIKNSFETNSDGQRIQIAGYAYTTTDAFLKQKARIIF